MPATSTRSTVRQDRSPKARTYVIIDSVEGRGQYVGTSLFVSLNAAGGWWGEGEVKFFMNGEEYPTVCGTGTEIISSARTMGRQRQYTAYSGLYAGMYQVSQPNMLYRQPAALFNVPLARAGSRPLLKKSLRVTIQDLGWRSEGRYLARRDDFMSRRLLVSGYAGAELPRLSVAGRNRDRHVKSGLIAQIDKNVPKIRQKYRKNVLFAIAKLFSA